MFTTVAVLMAAVFGLGQTQGPENKYRSQEIDESNGIPVLMEHLPNYDSVANRAAFAKNLPTLKAALGDRPELGLIDFSAGTEAATAPYPAGKLLIIEYSSPQASADADEKFQQVVAGHSSLAYRRIGNYNVFVFDVTDPAAANALLDQVKYEKDVQWLGDAPKPPRRGVSVPQMANVLFSSILWLIGGGLLALTGGAFVGYLYYRRMVKRRAEMATFSDAGGMTRLNLDGFTPEVSHDRLLGR
ncbi:MAG: hypothetical protein JO314_07830 [Acidobacteria bacterium]|nr:hypothetical protein [Acidobacteriota bacterium]